MTVAALCVWSIYALTNLYNRAAIPEFFAVSFLIVGLSGCLIVALDPKKYARSIYSFCGGSFMALTVMTHPITALYGMIVALFVVIIGVLITPDRKIFLKVVTLNTIGLFIVLSPWLYCNYLFKNSLLVQVTGTIYLENLDSWFSRLMPFPFDYRSILDSKNTSTPYLEAQINISILLLCFVFLYYLLKNRKSMALRKGLIIFAIGSVFGFFATYTLSVLPLSWKFVPSILMSVQFVYRLVTYQSIFLLLLLLSLYLMLGKVSVLPRTIQIVFFVLTATIGGLAILDKIPHVVAIAGQQPNQYSFGRAERKELLKIPPTSYGHLDYATPGTYHPFVQTSGLDLRKTPFPIFENERFGEVGVIKTSDNKPFYLETNVAPFPWNRIFVDGIEQENDKLKVREHDLIVFIPAGNHIVSFEFKPDKKWRVLYIGSNITFLIWVLIGPILYVMWKIRKNGRRTSIHRQLI